MQHEHASLIDGLGGGKAIAEKLWGERKGEADRRVEAVYAWKKNGIPWRWRPAVEKIAGELGIPLPPGFLDPAHEANPSSGQASAA